MRLPRIALALAVFGWCLPAAHAADISILDTNGPGEGFNDPTPATPVGLNFGTTRGQQALIAFQYAATIWGATLRSSVPIVIDAAFVTPAEDSRLACSASAGILGITGVSSFVSWPDLPVPQASYPIALADALLGTDLAPGQAHIISRFNADVGKPGCLTALSYYYGLTGGEAQNQDDLVSVFLHEFAHGFGFLSVVDATTGSFAGNSPKLARTCATFSAVTVTGTRSGSGK